MRNRYPGVCYRCGKSVAANEGHFERQNGRWLVQHASCAITFRGTNKGKEGLVATELTEYRARMERLAIGTGRAAQNARRFLRESAP